MSGLADEWSAYLDEVDNRLCSVRSALSASSAAAPEGHPYPRDERE
jgi:hypothetical protein